MIHLEYDPEKSKELNENVCKIAVCFHCKDQAENEIRSLISSLIEDSKHGIEFLGYINSELTEIVHKMEKELHDKNNPSNESN